MNTCLYSTNLNTYINDSKLTVTNNLCYTATATDTVSPSNYFTINANDLYKSLGIATKKYQQNDFKDIKEIVPEKVYEFTFYDNTKIKTIRNEDDPFDLEYMFYLALAKKLFSKEYTFDGVLFKACQMNLEKRYVKIVKKGIKLFNKLQKEKIEKEEQEAIKKRQHEKYVRKRKEAKKRKEDKQITMIAKAIRLSKEEG